MNEHLLNHILQFVKIRSDELQLLWEALELKKISKGELLLVEGNICNYKYFVIKGGLRQYEVNTHGKELIFHFAFENWWITDQPGFLNRIPSAHNIAALEETEVLQISRERLKTLFMKSQLIESYFHKVLQQSFSIWHNKILFLQKPAQERYRLFQSTYGSIELRISQQYIASYLGISRETLSRLRNQITK